MSRKPACSQYNSSSQSPGLLAGQLPRLRTSALENAGKLWEVVPTADSKINSTIVLSCHS